MARYHTLKKGESMELLSAKYKVPVCMIMLANRKTFAGGIRSGLSVLIPDKSLCSLRRTYTVKNGDTVCSISAKFGVLMKDILKLNGISHPSSLREGTEIMLPGYKSIYTAEATDTMKSISKKLDISEAELIELNGTEVYRGKQIILPL